MSETTPSISLRVLLQQFVDREHALLEARGKGGQSVGYSPSVSPSVVKVLRDMLRDTQAEETSTDIADTESPRRRW